MSINVLRIYDNQENIDVSMFAGHFREIKLMRSLKK